MNAKHAEAKDAQNAENAGSADRAKENFSPPKLDGAVAAVTQPPHVTVRPQWWTDLSPSVRAFMILASARVDNGDTCPR